LILDEHRRLAGAVLIDDVSKAIEQGRNSLQEIVRADNVNSVAPDASISDLIPLTVNSSVPLAVVDADKHLLGVIVKGSVLEAMIPEGGEGLAV